jgi:hypothetical protein
MIGHLSRVADRAVHRMEALAASLDRGSQSDHLEGSVVGKIAVSLKSQALSMIIGSPGRIRTSDQPVNSRLLYH